tara:strand:+ start:5339 stop:5803 length:465 start_codon:yes stop_codon:yes gene_type:complete
MFIALNTAQFNKNNTIISERTRNNVIDDSYFYRFYYSDDYFNTNGIFIKFNIKDIKVEKYYNKLKCIFKNNQYNNNIIKNIINIEDQILEKFYRISNSPKTFRISEQLSNSYIKLYSEGFQNYTTYDNINFLLKISGLWVSNSQYGITFRFYII